MEAIERLRAILLGLDGPATRERLREERSRIERLFGKEQAVGSEQPGHSDLAPGDTEEPGQATTGAASSSEMALSATGKPITALLVTPSRKHAAQLGKNYVSEPECLRLGHDVADDAVLIAVATIRDLFAVVRAVDWWKFKRCNGVYLLSIPESPNISDTLAMAIYVRGGLKPSEPMPAWPGENEPVQLADRLLQGLGGRRVHLFADTRSPGWEALVGDDNWATTDTAQ